MVDMSLLKEELDDAYKRFERGKNLPEYERKDARHEIRRQIREIEREIVRYSKNERDAV